MPIPEKKLKESSTSFMSRCMSDETMKSEYSDTKQRVAVCMSKAIEYEGNNLLDQVQTGLLASNCSWDDDWEEFVVEFELETDIRIYSEEGIVIAAEKGGRKVTLNKPFRTPDGPKKFSVYVKNEKGNVVKVNFGDPNMKIKKNIPERRKSFRARHNCDNPGPKWKARYWSCKAW
jgi:hypothetical protein